MNREKIVTLLEEIKSIKDSDFAKHIDTSVEKEYLISLQEEINSYKPKIAVIGEFSSGKSTLINSFLGVDLLPAKHIPTTSYITNILYSKEEYIQVDGEKLAVSKENIENIKEVKNDKIDIFLNNPILDTFSFIDTPGTNDPSKFSDEIVFSMIGDVDIVLFIFNSAAALKDTEKEFISKLVKKKDLEKFFFIFNKSDTVTNIKSVQETSLDVLSNMLKLDREILVKQSFKYSSIDVLNRKLKKQESQVFELFEEKLLNYIENNSKNLLQDWVNAEVNKTVGTLALKLDLLIDSINNDIDKYQVELDDLNKNINDFELEIQKSVSIVIAEFNKLKQEFKRRIQDDIKFIQTDIGTEISNMSLEQLSGSRYIDLRTKKLLEDKVEEDYKFFIEETSKIIVDFDKKIQKNNLNHTISVDTLKKSNKAKNIVNVTALMATGVGVASVAPTASALVASASGLAGLGPAAPALAFIPVVGPVLAGAAGIAAAAIPIIGVVALAAGKVLFDVSKWGVGVIGSGVAILEEKAQKKKYSLQISKSLDKIKETILSEIQKINLDNFKDDYIKQKFPQKTVLEKKMKLLENKQSQQNQLTTEKIDEIINYKNKILQLAGE